jgi:antitoxin VapB
LIRPIEKRSLAGALEAFAAFPADFMAEGREFHEQKGREWR